MIIQCGQCIVVMRVPDSWVKLSADEIRKRLTDEYGDLKKRYIDCIHLEYLTDMLGVEEFEWDDIPIEERKRRLADE